jgi:hypothetical protein
MMALDKNPECTCDAGARKSTRSGEVAASRHAAATSAVLVIALGMFRNCARSRADVRN